MTDSKQQETQNKNEETSQKENLKKALPIIILIGVIALIWGGYQLNKYMELRELNNLGLDVREGETIVGREDDAVILEGVTLTDELGEPLTDDSGEVLTGQVEYYQDNVSFEPESNDEEGVLYGD